MANHAPSCKITNLNESKIVRVNKEINVVTCMLTVNVNFKIKFYCSQGHCNLCIPNDNSYILQFKTKPCAFHVPFYYMVFS